MSHRLLGRLACIVVVFASVQACAALIDVKDLTNPDDGEGGIDIDGGGEGGQVGADADSSTNPNDGEAGGSQPGAPTNVLASAGLVTTLAGSGMAKFADDVATLASFNAPTGIALDNANGGTIYVADSLNHRIRKVTSAGVVSTLAGSGSPAFAEGMGAAASFNTPSGVAVDAATGTVYVADTANHRIRKVTAAGLVSTLAGSGVADHFDGTGAGADFNAPRDVTFANGFVYVADTDNHRMRRVVVATGLVTSLAGSSGPPDPGFSNGQDFTAKFHTPTGAAADSTGTNVFIADTDNHRLRMMATSNLNVTTPAGSGVATFADGTGGAASFNGLKGVAVDAAGNVYVADSLNHRIRKMASGGAGVVTTHAGSGTAAFADGAVNIASFNVPTGIAVDTTGATIYVGDTNNHRIRKVNALGKGQLAIAWTAPTPNAGASITGYTASASAAGHPTETCTAIAPATTCTIAGLASAVAYTISVTAMSGALASPPSASTVATPN